MTSQVFGVLVLVATAASIVVHMADAPRRRPRGTKPLVLPMPPWESRLHTFPETGPMGITMSVGLQHSTGSRWRALVFRRSGGQLVGFLLQHTTPDPHGGPQTVVVQVDPAYQRRGIATALAATAQALGWDLSADGQAVSDAGAAFTRSLR